MVACRLALPVAKVVSGRRGDSSGRLLFGGPLLKYVDDTAERFILAAVLIGVCSAGLVLMYYQGPDQRD